MTGKVFTKLFLSFVLVLVTSAAILDFTLRSIVEHSLRMQVEQSLESKAHLLANEVKPGDSYEHARQLAVRGAADTGAQVTFFGTGGGILAGSESRSADAGAIPPEVSQVLHEHQPVGSDERGGQLFVAVAQNGVIADANAPNLVIVALGYPLTGVTETMHVIRRDLLLSTLLATGMAILLAAFLAQRGARRLERIVVFANRIASGDFSARVEEGNLDEISDVAHALDVTASRLEASFKALEAKQRELAALLDSMQEAVVAVDGAGRISWSNSVMQRITPTAAQSGRALVHALRDPEVLACVEAALEQREVKSGKATSVAPGRVFDINAAPTPGGGAVAVLHDVTEIERAEKMRRDFVANVSHELRTPLTSISGYVETLLDDPTNQLAPMTREFLGIILKNATRMNRLTEDLLALASVESGSYRVKLRPVAAGTLVADSLESLAGMTVDSGVALEADGLTNSVVMVDEDALTQVFGNLVENAMKYGKSGGRVLVGARDIEGAVEFYVRDFGPGIGSEHVDRIFERFYRVDKARSRDSGGTGLGLAIAKHIVLAHGGTIRVESELGNGAIFLFTLPSIPAPAV